MEALELKGYRCAAVNQEVKRMKLASLRVTNDDLLFLAVSVFWVAASVLLNSVI